MSAPQTSSLTSLGDTIQLVGNLVALPLGTLGNVLVILVMARKSMRSNSASVYFLGMAVADLLVLYSSIPSDLAGWNRLGTGNSYSALTCILGLFFLRSSAAISILLLLALAVDRMIAVRFPLQAKRLCTSCRAIKVSLIIAVCVCLKHGHMFWTRGEQTVVRRNGVVETINCGYTSEDAEYFLTRINPLFSVITGSYIPVFSTAILNIIIIHELRKMQSFRRNVGNEDAAEAARMQMRSMTIMLVTASVLQFLLITPNITVLTILPYALETSDPGYIELFLFVRKVTIAVGLQNHALNFAVYCLSGTRFRDELKAMLGCTTQNEGKRSSIKRSSTMSKMTGISTITRSNMGDRGNHSDVGSTEADHE